MLEYLQNNDYWLGPLVLVIILYSIVYLYIEWRVKEGREEYATQLARHQQLKEELVKVTLGLLQNGMTKADIWKIWEEALREAEICHFLPACSCNDVNECETWCRTKARFVMNPPQE